MRCHTAMTIDPRFARRARAAWDIVTMFFGNVLAAQSPLLARLRLSLLDLGRELLPLRQLG